MLVARRFVFFDFILKASALDFGGAWVALASRTRQQIIQDYPRHRRGVEEDRNHTRRLYCLPPVIAACYPRSVNRNIFYIIGVIVVIVIVLKVLHVF